MIEPITLDTFRWVVGELEVAGFAQDDIAWSEGCKPPASAAVLAEEAIFVICNSGMKNTVARKIYEALMPVVRAGGSSRAAFGHVGKCGAIDWIWAQRASLFRDYLLLATDAERVEWCGRLPWVGGITKYHLAKNFGVDVAKPDVHLQRLADRSGETVQGLCERLAAASGYRARTVDLVLWRACAIGVIDSSTGRLRPFTPPAGAAQGDLLESSQ